MIYSNALQVSLPLFPYTNTDLTLSPDIQAWPLLAALTATLLHLAYATPISPPNPLSQASFSLSTLSRRAGPCPLDTSYDTSGPAPSYPGTINCFRSGTWLSQANIAETGHLACRNEDRVAMDARWSHAHFNFTDGGEQVVDSYLPCAGPVTDATGNTICYGDQDLHIRFDAGFKSVRHANGGHCEWAMQRIVDVGFSFSFPRVAEAGFS